MDLRRLRGGVANGNVTEIEKTGNRQPVTLNGHNLQGVDPHLDGPGGGRKRRNGLARNARPTTSTQLTPLLGYHPSLVHDGIKVLGMKGGLGTGEIALYVHILPIPPFLPYINSYIDDTSPNGRYRYSERIQQSSLTQGFNAHRSTSIHRVRSARDVTSMTRGLVCNRTSSRRVFVQFIVSTLSTCNSTYVSLRALHEVH